MTPEEAYEEALRRIRVAEKTGAMLERLTKLHPVATYLRSQG